MDLKQINLVLDELEHEKNIPRSAILETIELALAAAYKRDYGERGQMIRATFDLGTGKTTFTQAKLVVDETMIKSDDEVAAEDAALEAGEELPTGETRLLTADGSEAPEEIRRVRFNPERHIMLEDARKEKKDVQVGEEIIFPLEVKQDYGRIAAQTAKQVIIQRIREAERTAVWEEFKEKEGEIVSGTVQRVEGKNVFVDLGKASAILPSEEQLPNERYRIGERVKALLLINAQGARGPSIYLTRAHPKFVAKLFELEVPEIAQGAVVIKGIAREGGSRTKIAVSSTEQGIDPVGSLVGQKGVRVSTVITELGGEKIDIIEWSENLEHYIGQSLSPAKVLSVTVNEDAHSALAMVDGQQLSLAIGRGGQNVRLAARLTGYKIDVRADEASEPEETAPRGDELDKVIARAKEDGGDETVVDAAQGTTPDETTATPPATDEKETV